MHERDGDHESRTIEATALLPPPAGRCQICGAAHESPESILCHACGEPVLLCGWA